MKMLNVTRENIAKEHICCAITEKRGETCVADKKAWLCERFAEGLVFRKADVRGKIFIEYMPAEYAWAPIDAPGYMHIHCLWIAGQYKLKGYGTQLLEDCAKDAREKGMRGLTIISTKRKVPFMSDGRFMRAKGFRLADEAGAYELLYLPLEDGAPPPAFRPRAKAQRTGDPGIAIYYDDQCPYANTYALRARETARAMGRDITLHKHITAAQAQDTPAPSATYSFFYNGLLITNEILSPGKVERFILEHPEES